MRRAVSSRCCSGVTRTAPSSSRGRVALELDAARHSPTQVTDRLVQCDAGDVAGVACLGVNGGLLGDPHDLPREGPLIQRANGDRDRLANIDLRRVDFVEVLGIELQRAVVRRICARICSGRAELARSNRRLRRTLVAICVRALSRMSSAMSTSTTWCPLRARASATPLPMTPAPTTPTRSIRLGVGSAT
jgi:hypothetical protein